MERDIKVMSKNKKVEINFYGGNKHKILQDCSKEQLYDVFIEEHIKAIKLDHKVIKLESTIEQLKDEIDELSGDSNPHSVSVNTDMLFGKV